MRETITPTKGQSSTPKMWTTQLYQFISIYLIIFKSLTCIETKWKFKLGILTKIESKPTQQIKEVGRNKRGRSGNGKRKKKRKENWKKLKKEKRKENGGKLLHLSYSMFHLSYRDTLCPDLLVSRGTPLLDICVYNLCRYYNLSSVL